MLTEPSCCFYVYGVIAPACEFVCESSPYDLHCVPLAHMFHWLEEETTSHLLERKKSLSLKPLRPLIEHICCCLLLT